MELPEAGTTRLSASKLKAWREAKLNEQGGVCLLTHYPIPTGKAVADHDHETGHIRGVISRGANSMLGVIENNRKRFGLSWPEVYALCRNLQVYRDSDHTVNPIYPTHKTEDEKRLVRNAKARASRAKKKEQSC